MLTKGPRGRKDVFLVQAGARSCALVTVPEADLLDTLLYLDAAGLRYAFSGQKLVNDNRVSCAAYTYQRTAVRLDDPREGSFLLYVCQSDEVLTAAREADRSHDDTAVGRLLGYPECCIAAFTERFARHQLGNSPLKMIEPYWGADAPGEAPFVINVFARFYGQSILSHYPCGLDCTRSILLGYQYLSCLESAEPALAERLRSSARCEVAVSPTVGLWAFRWTGGEGAPRRGPVTSAVPWVSKTEDAWMFAEDRVSVEPAPSGIVLSNEAGQRRFVAAHSFHLH